MGKDWEDLYLEQSPYKYARLKTSNMRLYYEATQELTVNVSI